MANKEIAHKSGGEKELQARPADAGLFSLQREINRMFDDFFSEIPLVPARRSLEMFPAAFQPRINVSETDKEVKISAELAGLDEKDVSLDLDEHELTIRGEKKEEHEEKGKTWHRVEQSYGSFHRVIPLPASVDGAQAKATFKKGLLTVVLPKKQEDQPRKKTIAIQAG